MFEEFKYQCKACGRPIKVAGNCKRCTNDKNDESKTEPVFHKRESGMEFTQIMIKKLFRNNYVAEFKFKYPGLNQEIDTSIHSDSGQGCITEVSKFLQTELAPEEVTIKP